MNEKVMDDLSAIENALNQYKQDNGGYPLPSIAEPILEENKNVLCFGEDLTYVHDCSTSLFMQTQVDNELLTKRYLQEVPTDPRTKSRYVYGVTSNGKYFQVAGNFEEDDGVWTARTSGNLEEYPFLSGLIRSYNGPDFVVSGEGYLPYSSDHMSITATLADITGTVTIGSQPPVTNDSIEEERTAKPGATINTAPASSATLYFSDGSITYLDPNTTLHISPRTEVEQNDEDGIITKIRLKLTSGKIWNKVARLASESEFNVETTAAIAGVRGTEFGINFDATELIVRSGTVVARQFAPGEDVSIEDSFYFDNSIDYFTTNQVIVGDGTFKEFSVPAYNAVTTSAGSAIDPPLEQGIKEKYYSYTLGLSPADTPYIKKAESHTNGMYTLYITFNGFELDGTLQIDGFEIFGGSQKGSGLRSLKKDATTLLPVDNVTYSPTEKAYLFDIDYKTQPGNPLYNQTEGEMEAIVLKAFRIVNGKPVYSRLSWPFLSFTPDPNQILNYEFDNSNIYQEFVGVAQVQPQPLCGDGTMQSGEQCDDGDPIDYNECSNSCMLTNNLLYADYGGMTQSATADFALGTAVPDGASNNYNVTSAGLKINPVSGNYLAYEAAGNMPATGSLELSLNKSELIGAPYSYLFEAVDDSLQHVAVYKDGNNQLWFKVVAAACAITNINVGLSNLGSELKVTAEWNSSSQTFDFDVTDENNLLLSGFSAKTCTGSPPTLSFTTSTAMMYVGSKELGLKIQPANVDSQYTGHIKVLKVLK
ncbi:MAG TPA: hypothetical protein ENG14_02410 [Thermodesulforhabdus norvegica]|uniref:FecR protein domain-containing protein n=1 Tax=Thermodesulforhabdus norvegica TaxID=39841 RepID=A0A7C1AVL9_9BACT|nr:hypothetical protein [Thermodesulforhabdus norvegica]